MKIKSIFWMVWLFKKKKKFLEYCYFQVYSKVNQLYIYTSLVAQMVKRLLAMQETRVQPMGWEDPLEKEMAPHSSTLAWKIPWTEEPGRLQSMGSRRVRHD